MLENISKARMLLEQQTAIEHLNLLHWINIRNVLKKA
jgi:hypothetical protein